MSLAWSKSSVSFFNAFNESTDLSVSTFNSREHAGQKIDWPESNICIETGILNLQRGQVNPGWPGIEKLLSCGESLLFLL